MNVNISVDDCLVCKCNSCNKMSNLNLTSLDDYISIQCNYYLQLITVEPTYVVISINNQVLYIVRKLYVGVPIKICVPNCNCKHTLTITINSITT